MVCIGSGIIKYRPRGYTILKGPGDIITGLEAKDIIIT
jgi:hypothetical protein